ncbi:hypothetical protein Q7P37_000360 [Cladosporium fusiforme]
MASTTFDFAGDDSGSDHEHWPEDFKPAPAVPAPGYDTHNGLRMQSYAPASPTIKEPSPPPSSEASTQAASLTEIHAQYAYAPAAAKVTTGVNYAYVPTAAPAPAPAPKPSNTANMNTFTYHPTFSEKPAVKVTNKWQGRTKGEVEEDNQKIAAEEKVWDKRKVVPTGLPDDQMCWVVEADGSYTLRTFSAIKDLNGDWKQDPRYEEAWYFVVVEEAKEEK